MECILVAYVSLFLFGYILACASLPVPPPNTVLLTLSKLGYNSMITQRILASNENMASLANRLKELTIKEGMTEAVLRVCEGSGDCYF